MQFQQILYDVKDRIATITLNRPEQLNAWTDVIAEEVWQATHAADADDNVRVIILTGSGRAFCAGGDITGFKTENPRQLSTSCRAHTTSAAGRIFKVAPLISPR